MSNRKNKLTIAAMVLSGIMAAVSCTHPSPPAPVVSFRNDIIPILTTYCVINSSCHLGASSFNQECDLDSAVAYTTVTSRSLISVTNPSSSLLYSEVNGNGTAQMPKPPLPALSASRQKQILLWIEQGAKNN